nr:zinc finger A20 and AN1 domain-containing stress-associated protein 8-like [Ipomoea batatas]
MAFYFAESEGEDYYEFLSNCPKGFSCGNISNLEFPFAQHTQPHCGLIGVDCDAKPLPKLQLGMGGKWYQFVNIYSVANDIILILEDSKLQRLFDTHNYSNLNYTLQFPYSPSMTFRNLEARVATNMTTYYKCNYSQADDICNYERYNCLDGIRFYFKHPLVPKNPKCVAATCTLYPSPVIVKQTNALLTAGFELEFQVSKDCYECYYGGGQCTADSNNEFQCEKGNFKDMEQNEAGIQAPVLCVNNCGFFGTVATMNMCSKCYKDTILKQEQVRLVASSIESIMNGSGKSVDVVVVSSHDGSAESSAVTAQDSRTQPENNGGENTKDGPKRCSACRKRVGLTGFSCRCRNLFCAVHLYSDKHECQFDYQKAAQDSISKANPFRQRRNFIFATDLSNRRRPIARNGYSGTMSAQENFTSSQGRLSLSSDLLFLNSLLPLLDKEKAPMALPFIPRLFFLLPLIMTFYFSFAHGEDEPPLSNCPKGFTCGNIDYLQFPFAQHTQPHCGLVIVNCYTTPPTVQLETGGDWYQLQKVSTSGAGEAKTIFLQDSKLQRLFHRHDCSILNYTVQFQNSPSITFHYSNTTFLQCNSNRSSICNFERYSNCTEGLSLYYERPSSAPENDTRCSSVLASCALLPTPVVIKKQNALLTAQFGVEFQVSEACYECYYGGGRCTVDINNEFQCGKVVVNCYTTPPTLQLGDWYQLQNVSTNGKTKTIFLEDSKLQRLFDRHDCSILNYTVQFQNSPSITFRYSESNTSFLQCNNRSSICNYERYSNCVEGLSLYYKRPSSAPENYTRCSSVPASCALLPSPIIIKKPNSLLTAQFGVDFEVSEACYECYYGGGRCTVNIHNQFQCEKGNSDPYQSSILRVY